MQMNLKTTLRAFPKVSPSILQDYVTKDDLNNQLENYPTSEELTSTLENYVTEAPADNNVYGRENKDWVQLEQDVKKVSKQLYFGESAENQLDSEQEILNLPGSATIDANASTYLLNYDQFSQGYMWIVCTSPLKSIIWGTMGLVADYIEQQAKITGDCASDNITYYCYRIREELTPGQQLYLLML